VVDAHELPKRDFLTQAEVDRLVASARGGRVGTHDNFSSPRSGDYKTPSSQVCVAASVAGIEFLLRTRQAVIA
jgi:hypothetical protein